MSKILNVERQSNITIDAASIVQPQPSMLIPMLETSSVRVCQVDGRWWQYESEIVPLPQLEYRSTTCNYTLLLRI